MVLRKKMPTTQTRLVNRKAFSRDKSKSNLQVLRRRKVWTDLPDSCTTMSKDRNIAIAFPFKKICSKWFDLVEIKAVHKSIINDAFGKYWSSQYLLCQRICSIFKQWKPLPKDFMYGDDHCWNIEISLDHKTESNLREGGLVYELETCKICPGELIWIPVVAL